MASTVQIPLVGVFDIGVHKAEQLKEVNIKPISDKQDPYVVIHGPRKQRFQTKPKKDSGTDAVWEENFSILFTHSDKPTDDLTIELWDKNKLKDMAIGSITYKPEELMKFAKSETTSHELKTKKGEFAGNIYLDFKFTPGIGIKVLECKDLQKKKSHQNPYVRITYGSQKRETSTIKGEGTDPQWQNETHFFCHDLSDKKIKDDEMLIQVFSDNLIDKEIGEFRISWTQLKELQGKEAEWHDLFSKGNKDVCGKILLQIAEYDVNRAFHGGLQEGQQGVQQGNQGMLPEHEKDRQKGKIGTGAAGAGAIGGGMLGHHLDKHNKAERERERERDLGDRDLNRGVEDRGVGGGMPLSDQEKNKGQMLPQHEKDRNIGGGMLSDHDRNKGILPQDNLGQHQNIATNQEHGLQDRDGLHGPKHHEGVVGGTGLAGDRMMHGDKERLHGDGLQDRDGLHGPKHHEGVVGGTGLAGDRMMHGDKERLHGDGLHGDKERLHGDRLHGDKERLEGDRLHDKERHHGDKLHGDKEKHHGDKLHGGKEKHHGDKLHGDRMQDEEGIHKKGFREKVKDKLNPKKDHYKDGDIPKDKDIKDARKENVLTKNVGDRGDRLDKEKLGHDAPVPGDRLHGDNLHGDKVHGAPLAGDHPHGERLHGDRLVGDRFGGDRVDGDRIPKNEKFTDKLKDEFNLNHNKADDFNKGKGIEGDRHGFGPGDKEKFGQRERGIPGQSGLQGEQNRMGPKLEGGDAVGDQHTLHQGDKLTHTQPTQQEAFNKQQIGSDINSMNQNRDINPINQNKADINNTNKADINNQNKLRTGNEIGHRNDAGITNVSGDRRNL